MAHHETSWQFRYESCLALTNSSYPALEHSIVLVDDNVADIARYSQIEVPEISFQFKATIVVRHSLYAFDCAATKKGVTVTKISKILESKPRVKELEPLRKARVTQFALAVFDNRYVILSGGRSSRKGGL